MTKKRKLDVKTRETRIEGEFKFPPGVSDEEIDANMRKVHAAIDAALRQAESRKREGDAA